MSFCASCGRPRNGTARFCNVCGAEFSDTPADSTELAGPSGLAGAGGQHEVTELAAAPDRSAIAPDVWGAPDATRMDELPEPTRIDPFAAQPGQPDQFASWYQPGTPAAPDWQQPTQTVRPQDYQGQAYQPQGNPGPGYQATQYAAPGSYQPPAPVYGQPPYGPGTPPYQQGAAVRQQPPKRSRKGLFIVLAVLIVLAAGGGAYALATTLGKHKTAQPPASPTVSAPASSAGGSSPGTPSPSAPASPTHTPTPTPTPSPTLSLVAVSAGITGPQVPKVEAVLSHRFQGINKHDYDEYASSLTARERADESRASFDSGYGSTQDSGMTLTALTSEGSELLATVNFTSRQNPADSVDQSSCNTWTETLYLTPQGSGYVVDTPPAGHPASSYGDC